MIIYDIAKIPSGLDLGIWHQLYTEGMVIFSSKQDGIDPFVIDDKGLSLIDINNMTKADIDKLNDFINARNNEQKEDAEKAHEELIENNQKLTSYLKDANDDK